MKGGIAYTHDLGLQGRITGIIHSGNHTSPSTTATVMERFSHYAHLASGTFVVKNGERVEQGRGARYRRKQRLAPWAKEAAITYIVAA